MTRRAGTWALLATLVLAVAACASGGGTTVPATAGSSEAPAGSVAPGASEAPASPAAAACEVADGATGTAAEISGFQFPAGLRVAAGEAVTWTNADTVPHTVTFDDGSCDSGTIAGGASVTVTYAVAGTWAFTCRIHPNMQGSLEVEG